MIEMHTGDEPSAEALGDDVDHTTRRRVTKVGRIAASPAAMAIASVVISLASLGNVQDSAEIGDIAFYGSNSRGAELTVARHAATFRLMMAGIALLLAIIGAARIREAIVGDDVDDAERIDPTWVRAVTGAGLLVSLVAVAGALVTLLYALHGHVARGFIG